jgi:hypothetical protein
MKKQTVFFIAILSLVATFLTPVIFDVQLTSPPKANTIAFGAPFPFVIQEVSIPNNMNQYPLIYEFHWKFHKNVSIRFSSFVLSWISIFLLFIAVYSIVKRFFSKAFF